jgi:hypothetical protein
MIRIQQKLTIDCGIACPAMLSGASYAVARAEIFQGEKVTRTTAAKLRDALRKFGVALAPKPTYVKGRPIEALSGLAKDALVKTNVSNGDWHWMVWDGARNKHIDPKKKPLKKPKLHSYFVIERL